jgi:hypothetical protein
MYVLLGKVEIFKYIMTTYMHGGLFITVYKFEICLNINVVFS